MTFREPDAQSKRPHFRKTKSLEKLKSQKMQYAKKYANFFVMKDRLALSKEKEAAFETTENDSAVRKNDIE